MNALPIFENDGDLELARSAAGFWYVATPYSLYPCGIEAAFKEACRAGEVLIGNDIPCFVPIVHTHSMAMLGRIDPRDHEVWMKANTPMMEAAVGLIVVKMAGWQESKGIQVERDHFDATGEPVLFMAWK